MFKRISIFVLTSILSLSTAHAASDTTHNPIDPYEKFNRQTFKFNMDLDDYLLRPIAQVYKAITPWFVREAATNFFTNIGEIPNVANDLLQANLYQAYSDSYRFAFNSTFGLGGLVDVATAAGIKHHTQDFGLTLARWGWKDSNYLVIPFFGPRTIRDAIGIPVNSYGFTIYPYIKPNIASDELWAYEWINWRATLVGPDKIMMQSALDPYVFFRDAYLQKRATLMAHNNNPGPQADADSPEKPKDK